MSKKILVFFLCLLYLGVFAETKSINISPADLQKKSSVDISKEIENMDQAIESHFPQIEYKGAFLKMILTLIAILVLGGITIWSLKRLTRSRLSSANMNNKIKILEKRVISPKSILYLIEYEGKKMLVSESHLEMRMKSID